MFEACLSQNFDPSALTVPASFHAFNNTTYISVLFIAIFTNADVNWFQNYGDYTALTKRNQDC